MRQSLWRRFPVTVALVVVLIAAFAIEAAAGGVTDTAALVRLGALRPDRVREHGEYFRWFTAMWLHVGPIHLLLNLFALAQLGALVEHVWGSARTLLVYLVAGLAASALSAAFGEWGRPIVGASGAVMGLAGVLLGARYAGDPALRLFLQEVLGTRLMTSVFVTFAVGVVLELFVPMVDNLGHLGGFMAGLAMAFALPESDAGGAPARVGWVGLVLLHLGAAGWCAAAGDDALATLDHDTAVQLQRAVERDRGGARAGVLLANMVERYAAAGEAERGAEVYRRELSRLDEQGVQLLIASFWEQPAREVELEAALERWLQLAPHDPLPLNAAAWFWVTRSDVARRDPARAEQLSRKSLRRIEAPSSNEGLAQRAAFLDTLAEALLQLGRHEEALAAQQEAVQLAREHGLDELAEMEARLERAEAAR